MSLNFTKVTYVDGETVIGADNLNDMQDAILDLDENKVEKEQGKGLSTNDFTDTDKQKVDDAYVVPEGGIPKSALSDAVQTSLDNADTALQEDDLEDLTEEVDDLKSAISDSQGNIIPSEYLESHFEDALNGVENVNLFVPADATDGQSLIYNGNTTTNENMFVSDYIEVEPGADYTYSTGSTGILWIASYDSTKTFISGSWQTSGLNYKTKRTAKYIRFSDYLQFKTIASFGRTPITGVYELIDETNESIENVTQDVASVALSVSNIGETYYGKSEMDVSSYIVNKMYRINNGVLQSVTLTGYDSVVLPCEPNDVFFVSSVVAQADVLYLAIFCDQNMGLISGYKQGTASARTTYIQEKVVIPAGCYNVIFTSYGQTAQVYQIDTSIVLYKQQLSEFVPSTKTKYVDEFNGQERDSMLGTYAKLVSGTLKWTVLGDSITDTWDGHAHAGGGASDAAHGYAKIVARWLSTKYGNGLTFVNNGTGGITASGSIPKVAEYLEGNGFDLIVIALGTNDWNIQTALATFETNYNSLITEIRTRCPNAEIAMIGLGYFDEWKPEKLIREDKYNDVLQKVAREQNIRYVCPYYEMENAILNGGYTFADITYAPDPVHPNDIGHRIWADTAYNLFDIL